MHLVLGWVDVRTTQCSIAAYWLTTDLQCRFYSGVEWLNGSIGLNDDRQIVQQHSMMIYANIVGFGCTMQWLDGLIVM